MTLKLIISSFLFISLTSQVQAGEFPYSAAQCLHMSVEEFKYVQDKVKEARQLASQLFAKFKPDDVPHLQASEKICSDSKVPVDQKYKACDEMGEHIRIIIHRAVVTFKFEDDPEPDYWNPSHYRAIRLANQDFERPYTYPTINGSSIYVFPVSSSKGSPFMTLNIDRYTKGGLSSSDTIRIEINPALELLMTYSPAPLAYGQSDVGKGLDYFMGNGGQLYEDLKNLDEISCGVYHR